MERVNVAKELRKKEREEFAKKNIFTNEVIERHGLEVIHFYNRDMWSTPYGGMTVVYRKLKTNSFIEVATSICSKRDLYCRKLGKQLAVNNFFDGKIIHLPLSGNYPDQAILSYFGDNCHVY